MPHLPHCHKCSRAHLLRHTNNAAGHLSRHTQILMATNGLATCPHTHTHTHLAVHIERDFKVLLTIWQFPPDLAQRTHARARCVAHVRERNLFATCTIHAANGMQHCRGREKRNKWKQLPHKIRARTEKKNIRGTQVDQWPLQWACGGALCLCVRREVAVAAKWLHARQKCVIATHLFALQ